ncbi:MAG: hypothetical protein RJA04_1466 [Bacteroidota bacterium]|jgi:LysM repeat protein
MKFFSVFIFLILYHIGFIAPAQEVLSVTHLSDTYNFLLHKPANQDNQIKPVILFLHGRSLSGNNLNKVKQYGIIDDILHRGRNVDAYVIAPQVPHGQSWSPPKLKAIMDYVHSNYPTDKCRVYVVGMSLGGYGTMDYVGTYPEEVTAAMAMCGGGNVNMAESLAKVPLWIMHGKKDAAVPHAESEKVYNAIQSCCEMNLTRFSSFPNYGHGEFARVFYAKQMYDWLYQFEKDQVSADKLMDIEIFDSNLKRVYVDSKPKSIQASRKNDTLAVAKVVKMDSVLLMPSKKKQAAEEIVLVEEKESTPTKEIAVKTASTEKKLVSQNKSETVNKPTEIKVGKGETYYSLAKKYNIKIKDLLRYNKLTEKDLLKEGDKIKIPKP